MLDEHGPRAPHAMMCPLSTSRTAPVGPGPVTAGRTAWATSSGAASATAASRRAPSGPAWASVRVRPGEPPRSPRAGRPGERPRLGLRPAPDRRDRPVRPGAIAGHGARLEPPPGWPGRARAGRPPAGRTRRSPGRGPRRGTAARWARRRRGARPRPEEGPRLRPRPRATRRAGGVRRRLRRGIGVPAGGVTPSREFSTASPSGAESEGSDRPSEAPCGGARAISLAVPPRRRDPGPVLVRGSSA